MPSGRSETRDFILARLWVARFGSGGDGLVSVPGTELVTCAFYHNIHYAHLCQRRVPRQCGNFA